MKGELHFMMFFKMQGLGNDYVYIDCTNKKEPIDVKNLSKKLSDRHFGIGSDGLILLCKSNIADLKMRMFNKDGTEAQMCGNGIRCVAKLAYELGLIERETATIIGKWAESVWKQKDRGMELAEIRYGNWFVSGLWIFMHNRKQEQVLEKEQERFIRSLARLMKDLEDEATKLGIKVKKGYILDSLRFSI